MSTLNEEGLKLLFTEARTQNGFLDRPVDPKLLQQAYEIARLAPTTANNQAMRVAFVTSQAGKERLVPTLSPGNVDKTKQAPVTAIVAYDVEFYEKLPKLMPQVDARSWFAHLPAPTIHHVAHLNGSLQGAYLIIALRSLGLDCGPMGGFDNAKVDAEFFAGTTWKSNFLVNIGYGDPSKVYPRNPRLDFDEACKII